MDRGCKEIPDRCDTAGCNHRPGDRLHAVSYTHLLSQMDKMVKRGITELVTPGVAMGDNVLNYKENNFLAAVHRCV